MPRLESPRLTMRAFGPGDIPAYAAMIADPEVMRFMGAGGRYRLKRRVAAALASVSHAEARLDLRRIAKHWDHHGWGEWAVEHRPTATLVGRVGFKHHGDFHADVCKTEIGWMFAREHWGKGYATEAASMALAEGFGRLGLERVISISAPGNVRSVSVMHRLGMTDAGSTRWKGQDVMWTAIERTAAAR